MKTIMPKQGNWAEWSIVLILTGTPLVRELIMGTFFSHHGRPFATTKDVIHTLIETAFMLAVGIVLSWFRIRQQRTLEQNKWLATMVDERTEEIRVTQRTSIEALAVLSEYNDTDTGNHIRRIQAYVKQMAQWLANHSRHANYLRERPSYIKDLGLAATLHDIGKTAIPELVLTKSGKLTREEFELMKTHTTVAGEIFEKANQKFLDRFGKDSYLALARDIAYFHHEKWDGSGYPCGLKDEEIPLSARIVAVADVYDALITRRPYKAPWPHEKACQEIRNGSGTHFDPELIGAFNALESEFRRIGSR